MATQPHEPVTEAAPALPQAETVVREPAPSPEQPAPRPAPEPIDVKEDLSKSGLVMIETDHAKVVASVPEPEPLQLGRPRRERSSESSDEQLVQIETRK